MDRGVIGSADGCTCIRFRVGWPQGSSHSTYDFFTGLFFFFFCVSCGTYLVYSELDIRMYSKDLPTSILQIVVCSIMSTRMLFQSDLKPQCKSLHSQAPGSEMGRRFKFITGSAKSKPTLMYSVYFHPSLSWWLKCRHSQLSCQTPLESNIQLSRV